MYRHHFGLQNKPFQIVPNPRLLYASETHDEGRARVLYGIREGRGFVVVTGGVGLGKTTILLSVLEELDAKIRTALIFNPVETYPQLMRMLAHEFGLPTAGRDEVDLLHELNAFFVERLAKGEACVLIIDEAQNLPIELLERIRTLSNLQTDHSFLLQVVLVGQPELAAKLMDPRLVQLRQRVGIWHEVRPLRADETEDYILHRLRLAGAVRPKEIIPSKVCARVHSLARGVPRVVNQLCDTALLIAFGRDANAVAQEHVEEAARELRLIGLPAPRAATAEPPRDYDAGEHPRPRAVGAWRAALVAALLLLVLVVGAALRRDQVRAFLSRIDWPWSNVVDGSAQAPTPAVLGPAAPGEPAPSAPATLSAGFTAPPLGRAGAGGVETRREPLAAGGQIPASQGIGATDVRPLPADSTASWRAAIAGWRAQGEVVYSVHLGSFLSLDSARDFAGRLAASAEWTEPLYVERAEGQTVWYRVLAGGFRDPERARTWIRQVKQQRGLAYGQLTRLGPAAQELVTAPATAAVHQQAPTGAEG